MRVKLTISYDGTAYCGWQVQANATSIQTIVQQALEVYLRHSISLTGSSRTDAGVHALGQVAHFDTPAPIDPFRLRHSINALLPPDIRIISVDIVPDTFHARYDAQRKIYHYHLHLAPATDPSLRRYRTLVYGRFDKGALCAAVPHFLGTHDFSSFANRSDYTQNSTIRTLYRLDVVEQEGGIRLEFEGNGFLYKMVRTISGTLIDVASGRMSVGEIPLILAKKNRQFGGPAAPPQGLFLIQIFFDH